MTIGEVTLNRPEVFPGFRVIFCFCRLRPFRCELNFSIEIFTPCKFVPALEWVLGFRGIFLTILMLHLRLGI